MDEKAAVEAIKIDKELYQYLTEENMDEFLSLVYQVDDPEGNYIEEFDRKMREGGIAVNEAYRNQLLETGQQVPGVDLRTGEYGLEYAGEGFFSAGLLFFHRDEWDKALANFTKAIELRPRYVLVYSMKAQCHFERGEYLLAAAEMDNAILINPVAIAQRTGQEIPERESWGEDFIEDLTKILTHAYYFKGRSYNRLGMNDDAITALTEALKLNPDLIEAVEIRAHAFMKADRWKEAVKDCDRLIAAHHDEVLYLQYRGICHRQLHWYRKSIADFNAAIAMDPDLDMAYLQRALTYFDRCWFLEARADATEAIKRGIEDAYYYRARSNLYIGDFDDAIADFDVLLPFWPDKENIIYLRNLAEHEKKLGGTSHTRGPDGKSRDNSKRGKENRDKEKA